MKRNLVKGALGICAVILLFSFLYCDHSPFGSENPVGPQPTATPTPAPTATSQPTPTPTAAVTATPGPTPTPTPTPQPTPATLTGLWTGTYTDIVASGAHDCDQMSGPLALDIVQAGTDLTIELRSDNPFLNPLLDTGAMFVTGTFTDPTFTSSGELIHDGNIRTTVNLLDGTVSGNTITGSYNGDVCYTDTQVCFCFKSGQYTVSR